MRKAFTCIAQSYYEILKRYIEGRVICPLTKVIKKPWIAFFEVDSNRWNHMHCVETLNPCSIDWKQWLNLYSAFFIYNILNSIFFIKRKVFSVVWVSTYLRFYYWYRFNPTANCCVWWAIIRCCIEPITNGSWKSNPTSEPLPLTSVSWWNLHIVKAKGLMVLKHYRNVLVSLLPELDLFSSQWSHGWYWNLLLSSRLELTAPVLPTLMMLTTLTPAPFSPWDYLFRVNQISSMNMMPS